VPRSQGGGHEAENLILLCGLCRARHKSHYADYGIMPRRPSAPTTMSDLYAA
jgi:hypothetical protein